MHTQGPGLIEFTRDVSDWAQGSGLLTLFIQHTSCSLLIQENADPTVQQDLFEYFDRLVPQTTDPSMGYLKHTYEGPDDMPGHIKSTMMPVSLSIPVSGGEMMLGVWQGLYAFEHRAGPRKRQVVAHLAQSFRQFTPKIQRSHLSSTQNFAARL